MKGKENTTMQKIVSAMILWCLVVSGLFGFAVTSVGSSSVPTPEPRAIPQVIDGVTFPIVDWGTYNADGDISVINGGTLLIVNSTLNFLQNDTTGGYHLSVNNANLVLRNSTITTGASLQAQWDPVFDINLVDSNLTMTDHSALAFPGWLNVTNTRTYINDSWITSLWPYIRISNPIWTDDISPSYRVKSFL